MKLMPQEIEVRYVLPTIRKELAILLVSDFKQKEVANILNITPAAISQYMKEKRGKSVLSDKVKREIRKSSEKIKKDRFSAQKEIFKITKLVRETKDICKIHKQHDCVPKNCNFCFEK